jgi:hypothetical protein
MASIRNITNIRHARRKLTEILRAFEDGKIKENQAKTMTYIIRTIMDALVIEKDMDLDKKSNNGASQVLKSIVNNIDIKVKK